jgi:hypothetical protein
MRTIAVVSILLQAFTVLAQHPPAAPGRGGRPPALRSAEVLDDQRVTGQMPRRYRATSCR